MVSLLLPIAALIPALLLNFSWRLLIILSVMADLLVFRFFMIFPKLACLHCQAKFKCPQAGMMGEAPKLTMEESIAFAKYVLGRVKKRVPVIVGVSSPGLANLTLLSKTCMDAGAAGVLVAPPAGLHTDEQVFNYYASVCRALGPDIPVVVQDYPQATGVFLSVQMFLRLVQAFEQIKMLKHEDCP